MTPRKMRDIPHSACQKPAAPRIPRNAQITPIFFRETLTTAGIPGVVLNHFKPSLLDHVTQLWASNTYYAGGVKRVFEGRDREKRAWIGSSALGSVSCSKSVARRGASRNKGYPSDDAK